MAKAEIPQKGQIYGCLLLTGNSMAVKKKTKAECICQNCGAIGWRTLASMKTGLIKSCGCLRRERFLRQVKRARSDSPFWEGHGEISSCLWSHIKRGAESRGRCFYVSIEQAWDLFLSQNRKCALSGVELQFAPSARGHKDRTASLDRIISSKEYTTDNIQWVHKDVNFMKFRFGNEKFLEWCKLITDYQGDKL